MAALSLETDPRETRALAGLLSEARSGDSLAAVAARRAARDGRELEAARARARRALVLAVASFALALASLGLTLGRAGGLW